MLLEKYLNASISAGFVQVEGSTYKFTDHGQEYFEQYKPFKKRYIRAEKLLEALNKERGRLSQSCGQCKLLKSAY